LAEYVLKRFDRAHIGIHNDIKAWWGQKVGTVLSDAVVSDSGYLITSDEGEYLAAAFLYPIKGCETAMIGFPIANPAISKELRENAIHLLTTVMEQDAKKLNYRYLVSYAGSKGAVEMFSREGYQIYDKEVTNFGKVL
jgi:hypothetical protein